MSAFYECVGREEEKAMTSRERMLLEIARNFTGITNDPRAEPKTVCRISFVQSGPKDEPEHLIRAGEHLAEALGYDAIRLGPLEQGSWWQEAKLRLRALASRKEVLDRAAAVEDVLFGYGNINIDKQVVEMTVMLVKALKDSSSPAVVDAGLFLFLKMCDGSGSTQIFVKRLTISDRAVLNDDPTIVQTPTALLARLRDARLFGPNGSML
jgi:hypothetical protein